jgi:antirestriction protein ArdC
VGQATGGELPRNVLSKKPYRGINHLQLSASKYVQPYWLTMRQANELGGHVRKAEECTIIVFWKVSKTDTATRRKTKATPNQIINAAALRYDRVWNLEPCELPENAARKAFRELKRTSTIRSKPSSESLLK